MFGLPPKIELRRNMHVFAHCLLHQLHVCTSRHLAYGEGNINRARKFAVSIIKKMRAAIRRKKESTNARRPPTVARTRYLSDWIVRAKEAGADPTKLRSHQITLRQRQNKQAGPSSNLEVYIGEEDRANPNLGPPSCRFLSIYQNFCTARFYCEEASRSMPGSTIQP